MAESTAPPRVPISSTLTTSVVASVGWAIIDTVRVRHAAQPLVAFVALLGFASLLLGVVATLVARLRPLGDGVRAVILGSLSSAAPLAVAGSILQRTTHHRALGGMTFAAFAVLVVLFASGVAMRLIDAARRGPARLVKLVLFAVPAASGVCAALLLLPAASSAGLSAWVLDGALGAGFLGSSVLLAAHPFFQRGRLGAVVWGVVVTVGVAVSASQTELRVVLSESAPVAFAVGAILGG